MSKFFKNRYIGTLVIVLAVMVIMLILSNPYLNVFLLFGLAVAVVCAYEHINSDESEDEKKLRETLMDILDMKDDK